MNKQGARYIYMLLGGGTALLVDHECLPYTRQLPLECDINITGTLDRLTFDAANTNLCEDMT